MKSTVLVYGTTGNGKTTFAATAEHPILFLDEESRSQNIHPDDRAGIEFMYGPNDLASVYLKLIKEAKEGKLKFKTIVIDSLREVQRVVIDEFKKIHPSDKDKFTVWDKSHNKIHQLIRAFRDFPKLYNIDVIFTCPAFDAKDEDTLEQVPLLEGADKFIKEVMGQFDSIFYIKPLYTGSKVEYKLVTRDTGKIRAKNPSRTLQTVLDITEGNPERWTLKKVLDEVRIKEEVKA
jgi:AAA domain